VRRVILAAVATALSAAPARAQAPGDGPEAFALIVGVNTSVDRELPTLRYADDDAALYRDLFHELGARTYLLARFDDNTQRLHAPLVAEARPPRRAELELAIRAAAGAVAQARARGARTVLYFVYAGHGNVRDGESYLGLEDDRLTAADLEQRVVAAVHADQTHMIIDACYSGLLAGARGPGGERRPLHGFSRLERLADDATLGLVLSTSSARESHEWDGFQAGVFSHEVRSGLAGAADADHDGRISYRELAAFVARANAAIPNERFRPDIYARPPRGGDELVALGRVPHRRLEVDGGRAAHYFLEDGRGVRRMDFHNQVGQPVTVVLPRGDGPLFLRRTHDNREFRLSADGELVTLDALTADEPRIAARGAAHESFSLAFALPFDEDAVRGFAMPERDTGDAPVADPPSWRRRAGWGSLGLGGAAIAASAVSIVWTRAASHGAAPGDSQQAIVARNARISRGNTATALSLSIAGAALATGAALLLWPDHRGVVPTLSAGAGAGSLGVTGAF